MSNLWVVNAGLSHNLRKNLKRNSKKERKSYFQTTIHDIDTELLDLFDGLDIQEDLRITQVDTPPSSEDYSLEAILEDELFPQVQTRRSGSLQNVDSPNLNDIKTAQLYCDCLKRKTTHSIIERNDTTIIRCLHCKLKMEFLPDGQIITDREACFDED